MGQRNSVCPEVVATILNNWFLLLDDDKELMFLLVILFVQHPEWLTVK